MATPINKTPDQIMADIAKIKEMRAFQKEFFERTRKNNWKSQEEKWDAVGKAKKLESEVDAVVASYYPTNPKTTQASFL